MAKKKKESEKLTESQVAEAYEVVTGFNVPIESAKYEIELPEGTTEYRFNPGDFVFEKDFKESAWSALLEMEAIQLAEPETPLAENETIVFEEIE